MALSLENKIDQSSDIEIRTMKSDIEAIKAGGGDVALAAIQPISNESQSSLFKTVIFFAIIILIVAGIGFSAYYLALKFLSPILQK